MTEAGASLLVEVTNERIRLRPSWASTHGVPSCLREGCRPSYYQQVLLCPVSVAVTAGLGWSTFWDPQSIKQILHWKYSLTTVASCRGKNLSFNYCSLYTAKQGLDCNGKNTACQAPCERAWGAYWGQVCSITWLPVDDQEQLVPNTYWRDSRQTSTLQVQ